MAILWSLLRMLAVAGLVFGLWYSIFGWHNPNEGMPLAQFYFRICTVYAVFIEFIYQALVWADHWVNKEEYERMASTVVVGDWKSDIVEIRQTGKVHCKVQTTVGLIELIERLQATNAKGTIRINWWEAGLGFDLSAEVPIEVLIDFKEGAL